MCMKQVLSEIFMDYNFSYILMFCRNIGYMFSNIYVALPVFLVYNILLSQLKVSD